MCRKHPKQLETFPIHLFHFLDKITGRPTKCPQNNSLDYYLQFTIEISKKRVTIFKHFRDKRWNENYYGSFLQDRLSPILNF